MSAPAEGIQIPSKRHDVGVDALLRRPRPGRRDAHERSTRRLRRGAEDGTVVTVEHRQANAFGHVRARHAEEQLVVRGALNIAR
ncbi:MAG: hypothetical protein R2692_06285 [Microbacterium sp.]